jgi:protease I
MDANCKQGNINSQLKAWPGCIRHKIPSGMRAPAPFSHSYNHWMEPPTQENTMAQQQSQTGQELQGKRIAVLMTDGVEQIEYTAPRSFLEEHGAQVTLVSPKARGERIQGFNHLAAGEEFEVEMDVRDARPVEFDALLLPGGVANPDLLRLSTPAITFIREFAREDKPIAAICHGPWTLIDADIAKAKHLTSWPSLQQDLRNAGAEWSDQEVVVDGKLITSRKPDDIPAFNNALLKELQSEPANNTGPSS